MPTDRLLFRLYNNFFRSAEQGDTADLANRTFLLLVLCYILEGLAIGMSSSYIIYVIKRAAEASDLLVAMAAMCFPAGLLFSYPAGYYSEGRSKGPIFKLAALLMLITGVGFALVEPGIAFLPLILIYSTADAIKVPARNAVFQFNFTVRERSRFLGSIYVFLGVAVIIGTLVGGAIMDNDYLNYRFLFPLCMLLFALACMVLYRIPMRASTAKPPHTLALKTVFTPIFDLFALLNRDRNFLIFEIGFFLYGCGFMVMTAILPIFYAERFNASYAQYGFTGVILHLLLLFSPFIGKWGDKNTPMRMCAYSFFVLTLFPLLLIPAQHIGFAYFAHAVYSLGMVGVALAWNLGPIFFSGGRDASTYIGLHAMLVAIRALVAFPLAGVLKQSTAFTPVLLLSALFFFSGAVLMVYLNSSVIKKGYVSTSASGRYEVVDR